MVGEIRGLVRSEGQAFAAGPLRSGPDKLWTEGDHDRSGLGVPSSRTGCRAGRRDALVDGAEDEQVALLVLSGRALRGGCLPREAAPARVVQQVLLVTLPRLCSRAGGAQPLAT